MKVSFSKSDNNSFNKILFFERLCMMYFKSKILFEAYAYKRLLILKYKDLMFWQKVSISRNDQIWANFSIKEKLIVTMRYSLVVNFYENKEVFLEKKKNVSYQTFKDLNLFSYKIKQKISMYFLVIILRQMNDSRMYFFLLFFMENRGLMEMTFVEKLLNEGGLCKLLVEFYEISIFFQVFFNLFVKIKNKIELFRKLKNKFGYNPEMQYALREMYMQKEIGGHMVTKTIEKLYFSKLNKGGLFRFLRQYPLGDSLSPVVDFAHKTENDYFTLERYLEEHLGFYYGR
jgi:hypothetical protein